MRYRCFTLVELLVTIATITLLTAILLPSLQNSRHVAKTTLCSSNIRQLACSLILYDTENETFPYAFDDIPMIPPPAGPAGDQRYDRMGWWWFDRISDCFRQDRGKRTVLWCPSRQVREDSVTGNILCGNYGVNQSICKSSRGWSSPTEFIGTPLGATNISHPGQTLLVVDCGYSMITWRHATHTPLITLSETREDAASYVPGLCINKQREIWPGQEQDAVIGRHPNRSVNIGFVDGHVNRTEADDLFVEKTDDGYLNHSSLWVPK